MKDWGNVEHLSKYVSKIFKCSCIEGNTIPTCTLYYDNFEECYSISYKILWRIFISATKTDFINQIEKIMYFSWYYWQINEHQSFQWPQNCTAYDATPTYKNPEKEKWENIYWEIFWQRLL